MIEKSPPAPLWQRGVPGASPERSEGDNFIINALTLITPLVIFVNNPNSSTIKILKQPFL